MCFPWFPFVVNQKVDYLAKQGARQLDHFFGSLEMCCALGLYIILVSFKRYIVCFAFFLKDMHIFFHFLHFVFVIRGKISHPLLCSSYLMQ